MTPGVAIHNRGDVLVADAKSVGYRSVRHASFAKTYDAFDEFSGQLAAPASFPASPELSGDTWAHEPEPDGMEHVFSWGNVLQVDEPVVPFIPVDVVGVQDGWPNKCGEYESVDGMVFRSIVSTKSDSLVSVFLSRENAVRLSGSSSGAIPANPSEVGDRVEIFPSNDGAPLFRSQFFCGKLDASHREPPSLVPVVRLGYGAATSSRAVSIVAQEAPAESDPGSRRYC